MKAIVQDRYGPPDVLELGEVDKPVPADNEVLVRVHAAAVNARDWHIMRGDPYLARLALRARRGPKTKIRGTRLRGPGRGGRPGRDTVPPRRRGVRRGQRRVRRVRVRPGRRWWSRSRPT